MKDLEINLFERPSEMYNELMINSETIIDRINIIVSDNLSNILDTHWENLLYKRFIDRKILDVVVDKELSDDSNYSRCGILAINHFDEKKIKGVKNDALRKAKGSAALLAFDTKWLRDRRKVELEQVNQSVFVDGEIKQKYGFVKNNAKKLIVVFQSSWANINLIHDNEGKVTHDLLNDIFKYKKYQFFQFSKRNKEYDFVFLEDEFNYIYGWFTTNYGNMIVENIQRFMKELSKGYQETHFVGASKGGYGAYHIGKDLEFVDTINLIAPILDVESYAKRVNNQMMLKEISSNDDNLLSEIIERQKVRPIKPERIYLSTGKSDYNYEHIMDLTNEFPEIQVTETNEEYDHNDIILHTYKDVLKKTLNLD
ncbi:hypothetical protein ABEW90_03395 [Bacillus subtilis]|uniref:hypothetical protein n=1 Tax=Bacillus subtilis TaxID=1423 RepID=UPI000E7509AA|nr:hypothetical protein [Bacillus subtilis]MED1807681.1 hypothetical protein [Bacillus subtilis]RJS50938.1 hypothetical protein CJ480_03365 [Bacillus subtilis]UQZ55103.1 hypothetical protein C2H96_11800 [Bacillus subtilis]UQZ66522.1 hypothetical protein C2H97_08505 [Bacillus subtilis PY79]UQZ70937.1 hypothetical protein C2I05_10475 [Bacillus subtilis]